MLLNDSNSISIISCKINLLDYKDLLNAIDKAINDNFSLTITGANAHIINLNESETSFNNSIKEFNIIHFDGIGSFLAIKFLYPQLKDLKRITGSDFYEKLIPHAIEYNYSFFFFGDTLNTLRLVSYKHPKLKVNGIHSGFNFNTDSVIDDINKSNSDIVIVGLGSGLQEKWIAQNKRKIKSKVIIAVGDGIKVFAGNKKRGPKFIRMIGLEWFVRFLYEPKRLWKRYFIGIPLFIFRIIKFKFQINKTDL
ncbi:MAG: WecB/TagA/CpsF family glycosyltransferase [Ignavibacterium sp.]|jgi:N-acetylglucosaminyldiphosphoundecaprenol N-acetyl-beta-D-mannosaminyltransferase|nr:WecB/TagA/CpsF family glycosyltransferase [Ignavibacterium sp.]